MLKLKNNQFLPSGRYFKMKKIIVAMSGGVDSSVAAYLLKKNGYEVVGLSFELWDQRDIGKSSVCCSVETIQIAKEVAKKLNIEHYTVDVRDDFYRYVIENFCTSYAIGLTPNPCILCNKFIKFKFLLEKAKELGADLIATGHYARIEKSQKPAATRYSLLKGVDQRKDQSYVLYTMTQEELSKTFFPLGDFKKDMIRAIAGELGITDAIRSESQEICFVGNGNYIDFIKNAAPDTLQPGPIVNMHNKIIGEHKGIAFYTVGQRKRLGLSTLSPTYVVEINRHHNTIKVGSREDAFKKSFTVREINWISIESLSEPLKAKTKVRSTMKEEPSIIIPDINQRVIVEFERPQWAPAPGQSAVFYHDDLVIGGGVIE